MQATAFDERLGEYARFYLNMGRAQGRAALIAEMLAQRFGPLTEEVQARIADEMIWKLQCISRRLLTAQTLKEALDGLQVWHGSSATADPADT
jgi:hypothetical protein